MAFAICVKCGSRKPESFAVCGACKFDPAKASKELQAKSLFLSDEQLKPEALEAIAKQIKSGKAPALDQGGMEGMMRQLVTQRGLPIVPKKSSPTLWIGLGVVVAVAAVVALLLSRSS